MTRRFRSRTIRPPAPSRWSTSRSRSASSRFIGSPPGGLEAEPHARLVTLRPFYRMAPRSLAHRNHLHCAARGHSRRKFGPAVERRLSDWLHARTLRIRRKRRLGRFRSREPHHGTYREPSRTTLRIVGGACAARARGGMEPDLGPAVLHSERRAIGVGGAWPPGRVQPAAAAAQR